MIEKIRAEIERQLTHTMQCMGGKITGEPVLPVRKLLSFFDTLEEQPVEGLNAEIENYFENIPDDTDKIDIARHFYELGCRRTADMYDEIEYERQRAEEAENEEFEKELHRYWLEQKQKGAIVDGSIDDYITVQEVASHFAEWGAEHLKR